VSTAQQPNAEINATAVLVVAFIMVIAAFGVVAGIILGSEAKHNAGVETPK
jgi:hypothetical protein